MAARTNILLIVSDQHRYDCLGCSGKYPIKTPNLDRLADEGVFFEHAFTPVPVCAPARQAMLTGRFPDSYGALFNYDFLPVPSLEPDSLYWPSVLAGNGYRTAFVGKWHASRRYDASDFGYADVYRMQEYESCIKEKYPGLKYTNGWFGEESPIPFEDSQPHFLAGKVCEYIKAYSRSREPWHIRLDLTVPHLPCRPSKPFSDMYGPADVVPWEGFGDKFENKPYIQRQQILNWELENKSWDDWAGVVARYYAVITQIDDAVGRIMNTLDESGAGMDTVVIYTSDHGDLCGSHGMLDKHYILYDDVIRVPLIARWPGKARVSRRSEFVSNCLDLPATVADIAGIGIDCGHGTSLLPLITGAGQQRPGYSVSASNGQQFGLYTQRSIRTEKWKYIWNLTDVDELYNLEDDSGEKINLANREEFAGTVLYLRRLLHDELLRLEDPFVKSGWLEGQLIKNRKIGGRI